MNSIQILPDPADVSSVLGNGFSISEKLANGGKMLLVGMLTVFAVIFIIWLMLTIFRVFVYDLPRKKESKKLAEENSEIADSDENDDEVTVAVITAALAAYMAESTDGKAVPFRVVSFKKKPGNTPWNNVN